MGAKHTVAQTSQSPAVREIDVTFVAVPLVSETGVLLVAHPVGLPPLVTCEQMYWPILPAFALSLVAVPAMPAVLDGVIVPVAVSAAVVTVPVNVGDTLNTATPVPVSSDSTPASCAEVVLANCDRLPVVSANVLPQARPVPHV